MGERSHLASAMDVGRTELKAGKGLDRREVLILAVLALVSAVIFLVPWQLGPDAWFWQRAADLAHVVVLGGLALVIYPMFLRRHKPLRAAGCTMLWLTLFMLTVEVIQPLTGRSGSMTDLFGGLAGVLFTLAFLLYNRTGRTSLERNVSYIFAGISGGLMILLVEPVAYSYRAMQWRNQNFPVLSDFSTAHQQFLWQPLPEEAPALTRYQTGRLEVVRSAAKFSGVDFRAGLQDWSQFTALELDLENLTNYPLKLGLRVDDTGDVSELHSRFQEPILLDPGRQTVRIPLQDIAEGPATRQIDLTEIRRVVLFFGEPDDDDIYAKLGPEQTEFLLWQVRLAE